MRTSFNHKEKRRPLTREDLLSCVELGKALTSELSPKSLFTKIVQKISELLPAETWSLLLLDEETSELRFEVAVDLDVTILCDVRLKMGQGIAGQAALKQEPLVVEEVRNCGFFCNRIDELSGKKTQSVIAVPLLFAGKTVGVIELVNYKRFEERTLPLLSIIADYAAIAVENSRRYQHIENLSVKDDLTGLFNTRYLYRALDEMIRGPEKENQQFSLIFMDIDNFKKVVDTYGHLKGSRALQELAKTIRDAVHDRGFAVAYGGDEFVVVLPNHNKDEAIHMAMEIKESISATSYLASEGHEIGITASFGVATYPEDAGDTAGILALADHAMFEIKVSGKDGIKSS